MLCKNHLAHRLYNLRDEYILPTTIKANNYMNYSMTNAYQASGNQPETDANTIMLAEQIMAKIVEKGTPIYIDDELLQKITSMVVLQSVPAELSNVAAEILEFVYQTDSISQPIRS